MITQNGETHSAVENNIECKMVLSFKSLKDITASPPGDTKLRYVDLILWPPSKYSKDEQRSDVKHYEIKVLLGYTAPTEQQLQGLSVPADEIDAIRNIEKLNQVVSLGMYDYNINIKDNGSVEVTISYRGRLETVMGTNQVNIFQSTLRVGTNGRIDTVDNTRPKLNASHFYDLVGLVKSINSDLNKDECMRDCAGKNNLISLCTKDTEFVRIVKKAVGSNSEIRGLKELGLKAKGAVFKIDNSAKLFGWFKTAFKSNFILNELRKEVGLFKQQLITSFMESLIDGNKKDGGKTRVFVATAGNNQIKKSVGLISRRYKSVRVEGDLDTTAAAASKISEKASAHTSAVSTGAVTYSFGRGNSNKDNKNKTIKEISEEAARITSATDGADEEASAKDSDAGAEKSKKKVEPVGSVPTYLVNGDHSFYFVFLGDIIELACKNAGLPALPFDSSDGGNIKVDSIFENDINLTADEANAAGYPLNNAGIILGPLDYINKDGVSKTMNLARMPISFNFFKSWFIEKIVKMNRVQMPLASFLSSLINDLVVPSLGIGMSSSRKAPGAKSSIVSLTLPGRILSEKKSKAICDNQTIPFLEEYLPQSRVIHTESRDFQLNYLQHVTKPRSSESLVKTSYDYILIFISSYRDIIKRRGDPITDVNEGIYHFNIGSDRGLLKSMDFRKVNIPYLAALRSEQSEDQGVDQLSQLAFPFNTDVELVGTSLFTPGMYFYVNPSLAGLGRPENAASLSHQLGLGGYHLVQKVSTNIVPGKFVSKIEGTQTAQGKK
jgi:hypothetical protein